MFLPTRGHHRYPHTRGPHRGIPRAPRPNLTALMQSPSIPATARVSGASGSLPGFAGIHPSHVTPYIAWRKAQQFPDADIGNGENRVAGLGYAGAGFFTQRFNAGLPPRTVQRMGPYAQWRRAQNFPDRDIGSGENRVAGLGRLGDDSLTIDTQNLFSPDDTPIVPQPISTIASGLNLDFGSGSASGNSSGMFGSSLDNLLYATPSSAATPTIVSANTPSFKVATNTDTANNSSWIDSLVNSVSKLGQTASGLITAKGNAAAQLAFARAGGSPVMYGADGKPITPTISATGGAALNISPTWKYIIGGIVLVGVVMAFKSPSGGGRR